MLNVIAAATFVAMMLGLLFCLHRRSGRRWSKGLSLMCIGVLTYSLAQWAFRSLAISLPLFVLSVALIWGGGLMHNPEYRHALLHGDPPEDETDN